MTRRIERDLRRLPHVEQVLRTGGSHYLLLLANGQSVVTGSTPSDWRTLQNLRAQVRRAIRNSNNQPQETI
jgi:hypothetical protein